MELYRQALKVNMIDALYRTAIILTAICFIFPPFQNWKTIKMLKEMEFNRHFLREITGRDSGLTVLPKEVQSALKGLRDNNVSEFRMVGDFKKKMHLYQRLAESAWPARHSDRARIIVGFSNDLTIYGDCTSIYHNGDIEIVRLCK